MNLEKEIFDISLQDIIPNRFQPREMFDDEALQELSQSIKEHGVIQPIIVRKVGDKYEIIAGERRFRASQLAGKTTIPALVRDIDDKEAAKIALLENLQRSNLTPIEEAKTYQTILKLDNITQEELAQNLGKSQSTIANKLRLLNLDEEVQTALLNSQISERHARSLIGLDHAKQKEMLNRTINEKLTVKQLDDEIMKATCIMPENGQIQTPKPQNLSEGRISMDMNQNPVVQTPSFDNASKETNQVVPEINPISNNNTIGQINNGQPTQVPQVGQVNQNIMDQNMNNIIPQEPVSQENNINRVPQEPVHEENRLNVQPETEIKPQTPEVQTVAPQEEPPKTNIFDQFRVQNDPQEPQASIAPNKETEVPNVMNQPETPLTPEPPKQQATSIINTPTIVKNEEQNQTQNFNNIYDLRFAINNFRQAIQNTEKFGFKVKAEEYDSENKYQIVIEIEKKN